MRFFALMLTVLLVIPTGALAATDTFTIMQQVGLDNTPPTTPVNVVATPISSSRIDVTWDVVNDDFAVGGYQVFRDASQIATTSATSYSDTGLTASTTYAYTVRAFDTSFNYSTTSATSSTTTLPIVATATPPSSDTSPNLSGYLLPLTISNVRVVPSTTGARLSFNTSQSARIDVAWGRSVDYEVGYSAGAAYQKEHAFVLNNLDPGTVYEIKIVAHDQYRRSVVKTHTFTTNVGPDKTAPANPMQFKAEYVDGVVQLSWVNPIESDFAYVKVVSSDQFFPLDPFSGYLVYQGNKAAVIDTRALRQSRRYYSIFAYDTAGNVSSGAVTTVMAPGHGIPDVVLPDDPATSSQGEPITYPDLQLSFSDIEFDTSDFVRRNRTASSVYITDQSITTISIPYYKLPEHLKTILVTLQHPDQQSETFSFLLRINADKTAYEARIGSLSDIGSYAADIEVFDFKTNRSARVSGEVVVLPATTTTASAGVFSWYLLLWLLFIVLCIWWWLYWRRRLAAEDRPVWKSQ